MTAEPDFAAEMKLPEGKTCISCRHAWRCIALGFTKAEDTSCDFWPSRYAEAHQPEDGTTL